MTTLACRIPVRNKELHTVMPHESVSICLVLVVAVQMITTIHELYEDNYCMEYVRYGGYEERGRNQENFKT